MSEDAIVPRLRAAGCVFAEREAALLVDAAGSPGELDALVERRVRGEPLEYVVGWAEFCGIRFAVEAGVFVPRHRSELLVDEAAALVRDLEHPVVLDLCCGSGALGVALAARGPVELHATDLHPAAVRCARANLAAAGGRVYEGDLFEALPAALHGRVDVLLANVPYVPTVAIALMPPEARDHEHRTTLDGGVDGLDVLRRVAAEAPQWLAPGGHLLVESSRDQAAAMQDVLSRHGLVPRVVRSEDLGATAVIGRDARRRRHPHG